MEGKILQFFKNLELNIYDGNVTINLVDLFPTVKNGLAKVETVENLIHMYLLFKGLIKDNFVILDDSLKQIISRDKVIRIMTIGKVIKRIFPPSHETLLEDMENIVEIECNTARILKFMTGFIISAKFDFYSTMKKVFLMGSGLSSAFFCNRYTS